MDCAGPPLQSAENEQTVAMRILDTDMLVSATRGSLGRAKKKLCLSCCRINTTGSPFEAFPCCTIYLIIVRTSTRKIKCITSTRRSVSGYTYTSPFAKKAQP